MSFKLHLILCNFPDISYLSETQKNNFQFLNKFPAMCFLYDFKHPLGDYINLYRYTAIDLPTDDPPELPKMTPQAVPRKPKTLGSGGSSGGSMVTYLKLKGIDWMATPGVEPAA